MLVTLVTGIIGYGSFLYWYMDYQYKKASQLSQTVALVLGQDAAKLLLLNDVSAASDITANLKSFNDLEKLVLFNKDKKPLYQYSKQNKSFDVEPFNFKNEILKIDDDTLKIYSKANYQNTHLGYIEFHINIETIFHFVKEGILVLFFITLIMFIFSFFMAHFFANKFTDPILKLVKYLAKVEKVDFIKDKIYTKEENEYGVLYDEVNIMLERIKSLHEELKLAAVAFNTQNGVIITDKNQKIIRVNKAFTKITGYEENDILGKTPAILKSNMHDKAFYEKMYNSLLKNNFWIGEVNNKHKNGNIVSHP